MKHLSKLAKKQLPTIPQVVSGQKATHVWNKGRFQKLLTPTNHSEISCPMCGGYDSYLVKDATDISFIGWSCTKHECVATALNKTFPISYTPHKPSLANCGVLETLQNASFEEMEQEDDSIKLKLKEFCVDFKGFVLLPGRSGNGKSYASVCCLREFLKKHDDGQFINIADLYSKWLSLNNEGASNLPLAHKYSECKLLILDDLGTRTPSESFLDFIYLIINNRSEKTSVGTIISSNLTHDEMSLKLGDAITSRICSGRIIKFNGQSKRKPLF